MRTLIKRLTPPPRDEGGGGGVAENERRGRRSNETNWICGERCQVWDSTCFRHLYTKSLKIVLDLAWLWMNQCVKDVFVVESYTFPLGGGRE